MSAMSRWLWLPLLATLAAGCVGSSEVVRSTAWLQSFRPTTGPGGTDVIQMDVALLERPVGDRYINQDLWTVADEQVIALDRKAVLADDGLKVGQLGGIPPAGLQALLTSERTCANRAARARSGHSYELMLAPARPAPLRDGEGRARGRLRPGPVRARGDTDVVPDGRTLLDTRSGTAIQHLPRPGRRPVGVGVARSRRRELCRLDLRCRWRRTSTLAGGARDRLASFGNRCFTLRLRSAAAAAGDSHRRVAPSVVSASSARRRTRSPSVPHRQSGPCLQQGQVGSAAKKGMTSLLPTAHCPLLQ
jgi:hypothetical protein